MSLIFVFCLIVFVSCLALAGTADCNHKKPSPDEVIKMLQVGNERFFSGRATFPHADAARLEQAGKENQGKHAYATVISCSDSRVPVIQ